ncbi:hypothetical protein LCGC14_1064030 [marine sediment metagenome]|uniref:Uncharacterized protein n=1 Tax=marine sediment metagenome TaxID=412755 RepID=A0A0F9MK32_9ZZZZ
MKAVYIPVAVCNFDDVILGAFGTQVDADKIARKVARKPDLRFTKSHQATDTEFLWCRTYRCMGEHVEQVGEDFEPGGKRAKKQKERTK